MKAAPARRARAAMRSAAHPCPTESSPNPQPHRPMTWHGRGGRPLVPFEALRRLLNVDEK